MFSYQKVLQTNVGTWVQRFIVLIYIYQKIDERSRPIYDAHPKVYVCYRYTFMLINTEILVVFGN